MKRNHLFLFAVVAVALVGCVTPLVVGILGETPLKFEDVGREEDFAPYIGRQCALATDMLVYGVCLPPGHRDTVDQYFITPDIPGPTGPEILSKERLAAGSAMEIVGVRRSVNHVRLASPTVEALVRLPDYPKAADVPVTVKWDYVLRPEYWTVPTENAERP